MVDPEQRQRGAAGGGSSLRTLGGLRLGGPDTGQLETAFMCIPPDGLCGNTVPAMGSLSHAGVDAMNRQLHRNFIFRVCAVGFGVGIFAGIATTLALLGPSM